jgi:peptidyl-prolyl cis-trans isomerase C
MVTLLLLALPLFAAEPAAPAAPAANDPVVARVEGVAIHASDVVAAAAKQKPADGVALSEAERAAIVDGLVGNRLLLVEARKNPAVLEDPAVRDLMVKVLVRDAVRGEVPEPTPAQLREYYTANTPKFMTPETARVSRILVRTGPKKDAKTAVAELQKLRASVAKDPAGTFATTAKASSQDANKAKGGDMGMVSRTDPKVDAALKKAVFGTKVGQVSGVFLTKEGANVVFVVNRKAGVQRTFEQARADVEKRWRVEQTVAAQAAYVATLRKSASVSVDAKALAAVALPEKKVAAAGGEEPDEEEGATGGDE